MDISSLGNSKTRRVLCINIISAHKRWFILGKTLEVYIVSYEGMFAYPKTQFALLAGKVTMLCCHNIDQPISAQGGFITG